MLAKAEQYERRREDFENLAMAYLRLAEQADRNAKLANRLGRTTLPPIKSSSRSRRYDSNSNTRPKIKPWIDG
jgi:uncharacterized protein with von Willebrand factor type A (vWA) domain